MRDRSEYTIMSAGCLFDNKAANVQQVIDTLGGGDQTILVASRESGYDKYSKLFISGAGVGYGDPPHSDNPISTLYTQDTGNGYSNMNKGLRIVNFITIKDGVIDVGNGIGATEKRRVWVMK